MLPLAAAVDRLSTAAQAVPVAGGHQRESRGRTHWRVVVALGEAQAVGGKLVDNRRYAAEGSVAATVAAEIGEAEIVGDDEDDVG